MARPDPSLLGALGLAPAQERTYEALLRQSGLRLPEVAAALGRSPRALEEDLAPLGERGLLQVRDGRVHVEAPASALARLIVQRADAAASAQGDLVAMVRAVPLLVAAAADSGEVDAVRPIDGEVTSGGNPAALIASLLARTRGDLVWLRPDTDRLPPSREAAMVALVRDLVASGRRSRAIYPVRLLHQAPRVVHDRAEVGEEIRVLPDVPTRMFVIGTTHAVLPEPLGFADEPRTLVRQQGIVEALVLLFEQLWERASPVQEFEVGDADLRRFLLAQLAAGAHDEQIARKLGISLRTVRRRVADLMSDLGADSRFQAGVEAARRGWL